MITKLKALKSIRCAGGEVHRRLVSIDGVPIVLLNKTHPVLRPTLDSAAWQKFAGEATLPAELAAIVQQWNRSLRFSFNCHLLAIGHPLGLTTDDWLEGTSGRHTLLQNPAQDLLAAFYEPVSPNQNGCIDYQHGDVVVIRCTISGDLVHSGRIWQRNGMSFVISKIGEHPVAATSLGSLEKMYGDGHHTLESYRRSTPKIHPTTHDSKKKSTRHSRHRPPHTPATRRSRHQTKTKPTN